MSKNKNFCRFWLLTAGFCLLAACRQADLRPPAEPAAAPRSMVRSLQRSGFLCCNLHHDGERWREANQSQLPFIPAATPVRLFVDGERVTLEAAGRSLRVDVEPARIESWAGKWLLADDPAARFAAWPAPVRAAVAAGQLLKGMTREQVLAAAGQPAGDEEMRVERGQWRYWWSDYVPYYVHWLRGSVSRVEAPPEVLARIVVRSK